MKLLLKTALCFKTLQKNFVQLLKGCQTTLPLNCDIDFKRIIAFVNPQIFLPIWKCGRPNDRFRFRFYKY